jgi:hypothetical protein
MYENVIFADEDEDEGDTQAVEDDLIGIRREGETKLAHRSSLSAGPVFSQIRRR